MVPKLTSAMEFVQQGKSQDGPIDRHSRVSRQDLSSKTAAVTVELDEQTAGDGYKSSLSYQRDMTDMHRMGKQQLFRRDFNFIPSVAFVILVQLSWVCFLS